MSEILTPRTLLDEEVFSTTQSLVLAQQGIEYGTWVRDLNTDKYHSVRYFKKREWAIQNFLERLKLKKAEVAPR